MNSLNQTHDPSGAPGGHEIQIADSSLNFRTASIDDATPTGDQLARAAGFKTADTVTVLHFLPDGDLEDIRPTETVALSRSNHRFVIEEADRAYRFLLDGQRFDWVSPIVSGALLRKLGQVPPDKEIYFELDDEPDQLLKADSLINLDADGVESFKSRKPSWKLEVHNVLVDFTTSMVSVRDAVAQAGYNPDQGWQFFFKVAGQDSQKVELTTILDLSAPGVEKLRLVPEVINNGESVVEPPVWHLQVQNVSLDFPTPTVGVKQALLLAGFDPDQDWMIFLKSAGQSKQPVELTTELDLRSSDEQRLRIVPKDIRNGIYDSPPERAFALQAIEESHLSRMGLRWETVVENNRRWLLIHDFPLPPGYTRERMLLALEIPSPYPGAEIYGFYVQMPLALTSGRPIPSVDNVVTIRGIQMQRWSRNRHPKVWNPSTDNVMTQLTLVDGSLAKEVGA